MAGGGTSAAVASSARGGSIGGRMLSSTAGVSSGGAEVIVAEADGVDGWPMSPPATSATAMQTRPVRPTPVRTRWVPAHAATGVHHDGRRRRDW